MANVKVSKKGWIVFLSIIVVIGLGVGLFFILKPKPDLKAPYDNTYSLVYNQDFEYVKTKNVRLQQVLIDRQSDISSIETFAQTKEEFTVYNQISEILDKQNEIFLDNLKFAEDKGEDMAKLQQEIKKVYNNLNDNIEECKTYLETYLASNNQINSYTNSESLYQKIYNYKFLYQKLIDNQTKYYEYMSKLFAEYLTDTISVNRYNKIAVQTTSSWARKITEYYLSYNQENMVQYNFTQALSKLIDFTNAHSEEEVLFYVNNKENCDLIADHFANVNFEECVNALATYKYNEYTEGLEGNTKESANALKNYFLV